MAVGAASLALAVVHILTTGKTAIIPKVRLLVTTLRLLEGDD